MAGWIARYNTLLVPCPLLFGKFPHQPPLYFTRRHLSNTPDNILHNQETGEELSVHGLLDLGFTDSQAEHIYDTFSKSTRGSTAKHALSTLSTLIVLGFNPSSVLKLVEKCPELYLVKESQLQQRIGNLRKLGLVEGSLQRVVSHHPQILTMKMKKINHRVLFLKEKCLFTTQQVTDIFRDSPAVIQEDLDQLEYKFQYVYFRMGVKQAEMVKSRLFRFTLDEVRNRHCFLERQTTIVNPKISSMLSVDQDMFVTQVAKATSEEFDVFQRLLMREWQEEDLADFGNISDDEEEEDDGGKRRIILAKWDT
uniref:Mitochondrial transcription termination factor 4 n=1 Tax=Neogobius melanostomus TaxID=47308 RepID=A0A8C6TSC8_9GOBI